MESCWSPDPVARPSAEGVLSKVKPNNGKTVAAGGWSDSLFSEIWNNVEHQALDEVLALSHVAQNLSDDERKRQEIINEIISFEKAFLRDMEYLRDIWMKRLQTSVVIPAERRTSFIEQVFWNVNDIITIITGLRDALVRRQEEAEECFGIVEIIGDIFLGELPRLDSFVSYGVHQLYAKYDFEKEKNTNPAFSAFVDKTESLPGSRKRKLSALLSKPTTHLARHPLLLEAVLNYTPDSNPDKKTLPVLVAVIKENLAQVNAEMGKIENKFSLTRLDRRLVFKPGNEVDLGLAEEGREIIYNSLLAKKNGELKVYPLDHVLLFTKPRKSREHEQLKVYRPPVPLQLLHISCSDDPNSATEDSATFRVHQPTFWINFTHLGRKHSTLLLWANSRLIMEKWTRSIRKQQQVLQDRSRLFDAVFLSKEFFTAHNKVNCAALLYERKMVYGAEDGVYISDLRDLDRDPVKVLALPGVLQIDVLEEYQLLIVLLESQVFTYTLDILDPTDPKAGLRHARRISSNTSFFKTGKCLGRTLICIVKSTQLSSTIKVLEPVDRNTRGRWQLTFRKLLQGGDGSLELFKEFHLPVESWSIHFLKTKICVGSSRGFDIVDLETLDYQGFLNPGDESLEFVAKADNLRPMAFFRIRDEFLVCYDAFAFYVDKIGMRARKEFLIHWEGTPTAFALHGSYVLAFDRSFVEIRHIETGALSQVIQGLNLRLMVAGPGRYYGPEPLSGYDNFT
ncbi:CNH-domain-containing protein [Marasmius fiardii PR-910]|nr:CNH-domain-containing protein [Marasmius fiardii PR-910]